MHVCKLSLGLEKLILSFCHFQLVFVLFFPVFSPVPDVRFRHQPQQDLPAPASSQPAVAPSPVDDSKPVTSIQIRLADGTR